MIYNVHKKACFPFYGGCRDGERKGDERKRKINKENI